MRLRTKVLLAIAILMFIGALRRVSERSYPQNGAARAGGSSAEAVDRKVMCYKQGWQVGRILKGGDYKASYKKAYVGTCARSRFVVGFDTSSSEQGYFEEGFDDGYAGDADYYASTPYVRLPGALSPQDTAERLKPRILWQRPPRPGVHQYPRREW